MPNYPTFPLKSRSAGLLLHATSLPGSFGIGDLGAEAFRFADFLSESGLRWWQMLPVGPVGAGFSPYSSPSSFAGNEWLISPQGLAEDGLITESEWKDAGAFPEGRVDYPGAARLKESLLRKAFGKFPEASSALWDDFKAFHSREADWLEDYSLYRALGERFQKLPWTAWDEEARLRRFKRWEGLRELGQAASFHQFSQWVFDRQWRKLKNYCGRKGVGLIGDIPIFVAHESADVWSHQDIFRLDSAGRPEAVAGVPPDYFSSEGQLWGNPLYRWDVLRQTGYGWWLKRFAVAARRFDAVRLDHFIGFERCWEVSAQAQDARGGRWVAGPGADFFEAVLKREPSLQFIAEDLGSVTPEVTALRERFDFPGMRVLQFAFGDDSQARSFLPHNYPRRCLAYTGTHDNDTAIGWFRDEGKGERSSEQARREREAAMRYLASDGRNIHWDMIEVLMRSTADTVIFPAQDVLGLGAEARMNRPGRAEGNWVWRLKPGELSRDLSVRLRRLSEACARLRALASGKDGAGE